MGTRKERGKEIKGKRTITFLYASIKNLKDVVEEKKIPVTGRGKAKMCYMEMMWLYTWKNKESQLKTTSNSKRIAWFVLGTKSISQNNSVSISKESDRKYNRNKKVLRVIAAKKGKLSRKKFNKKRSVSSIGHWNA